MVPSEKTMGRCVDAMIGALERYCESYRARFETAIGDDHVIGKEGAQAILDGLRIMLAGPTGHLDCGDTYRRLRAIANANGLSFPE